MKISAAPPPSPLGVITAYYVLLCILCECVSFSQVFQGSYRGMEVAVKRLLNKPGPAGVKAVDDFKAEVAMMTRLRHPNIGMCALCVLYVLGANGTFSNADELHVLHDSHECIAWV